MNAINRVKGLGKTISRVLYGRIKVPLFEYNQPFIVAARRISYPCTRPWQDLTWNAICKLGFLDQNVTACPEQNEELGTAMVQGQSGKSREPDSLTPLVG